MNLMKVDEEQVVKMTETVELLVAAGYFRARIKGLDAFDKVVGGITWCCSLCDYDIDVDLFYQENSTIGQKISLTERIVAVLSTMKCPYAIEPHQILGLDMIHIFPVVQWLVRQVMVVRTETEDSWKAFAVSRFDAQHPSTSPDITALEGSEKSVKAPQRLFKRKNPLALSDEETQVKWTLFEYNGRQDTLAKSETTGPGQVSSGDIEAMGELLTASMIQTKKESKISAASVASLINRQAIQQMAEYYDTQTDRSESADRNVPSLRVKEQNCRDQLRGAVDSRLELVQSVEQKQLEATSLRHQVDTLVDRLNHSAELEKTGDSELVGLMKALMEQHELVKNEEHQFKQNCRLELDGLKQKIRTLQTHETEEVTDLVSPELLLEHETLAHQMKTSRLAMATLNQQLARLQRQLDQIPSQAESIQYQRRFLELNNQISAKLRETKQFFTMFNTLQNVQICMEKEISLLDSVYEHYHKAMGSEENKRLYLTQLDGIVNGIRASKMQVEKQQGEEKNRRDQLQGRLSEMNERERLYYKTVKDLQQECRRNELLQANLHNLGATE